MKTIYLLFIAALLLTGIVAAEQCTVNLAQLRVENLSLEHTPGVKNVIGNNKNVHLQIDEESFYYHVGDGIVNSISETEEIHYDVTTDSCTVDRIMKGSDPVEEYNNKNIIVKGRTAGAAIKMWFIRAGVGIYGWFN